MGLYRHEFRDSETAIHTRASSWDRVVAAQFVSPGTSTPLSEKQHHFKKAKDTTRVLRQPQCSFINKLVLLISSFERRPDKRFLQELKTVLSTVDEDIKYAPIPGHTLARQFVDKSEDFQLHDTTQILAEISEQWPKIVGVHCKESTIQLFTQAVDSSDQAK